MKRLFILATVLICFLLLMGTDASAAILNNWILDLNAVSTGLDTVTGVDYISWDSPGANTTTIKQYLGGDGILNDGDPFVETGYMQTIAVNTPGLHVLDLTDNSSTSYNMFAVFQNVTGHIYDYDNNGTPLDITDDSWKYVFDTGSGAVSLVLDTNSDPLDGADFTLMTGSIVPLSSGTADGFIGGADPVSNWAMTLVATSAFPNVLLDTDGVDLWTRYGAQGYLLALPQGDTELDGASTFGADGNGAYILFGGHTGDTMKLAAVPEPASMVLLGIGLVGAATLRRKKVA